MTSMELTTERKTFKGFDSCTLKYIAIICMFIDHVAWGFVETTSPLGIIMHIIGRFTGPIMFFFVAEGYHKTSNFKKYALRLGIFTIISAPFFMLFFKRFSLGIIFTLLLGLITLSIIKSKVILPLKIFAFIASLFISAFGDWPIYGILFILAFGVFYGNFKKQAIAFMVVLILLCFPDVIYIAMVNDSGAIPLILINACVFLPLILIYFYNGKRGGEKHKSFNKWIFYIFYPAHLLVLWGLSLLV